MVIARPQVEAEAADDLISGQEHTCAAFGCAALLAELDILPEGTYERLEKLASDWRSLAAKHE